MSGPYKGKLIFNNISIRNRLLIFFVIIIIIPLTIVGLLNNHMSSNALSHQVQTSYMEIVKQVCEVTNISMEDVERKIKSGSSDVKLWSALEAGENEDPIAKYDDSGYIQSFLQSIYINESTFDGAAIITRNNTFGNIFSQSYLDKTNFFETPFYKKIKEANGGVVWEETHENTFGNRNKVITAARLERDGGSGQELGVSIINLKPEFFRNILKKVSIAKSEDIELFIASPNGRVVGNIGSNELEGAIYSDTGITKKISSLKAEGKSDEGFFYYKNEIVFFDTVLLPKWTLVAVVPDRIIMEPVSKVRTQIIWIAFLSVIASMLLALSMAQNVIGPIKSIINVMKKAEGGDLAAKCGVYGNNEMSFLGESFNKMMYEVRRSRDDLQNMNMELEAYVEDRTKQLKKANEDLLDLNKQLNQSSKDQQEKNIELKHALETIRETQNHLIQSEKMAALGNMMAGVAHEVNTPLGVGVTAVTYLQGKTNEILEEFRNNQLKKSSLEDYLNIANESSSIAYANLYKASELIKSFKRVSVDISNEEKSVFNIPEYLNSIVLALSPEFKGKNYNIEICCDKDLEMLSYPGIFSQIFTNLIINSIIHGFERGPEGSILISVNKKEAAIVFEYSDNGKGISIENSEIIFDLFFTTKRSEGGTGLGLYIVNNIVTQNLGGTIQVKSELGKGTTFIIEIPIIKE